MEELDMGTATGTARTEPPKAPGPKAQEPKTKKLDANDIAAGLGLRALIDTAEELVARAEVVFKSKRKSFGDMRREFSGLRPPVLDGLLRQGEVMNIVASPKVGKSWCSLSLTMAIITGMTWLEKFKCAQGPVLIIDNELHEETITHRISVVARALGLPENEIEELIDIISLRGGLVSLRDLKKHLEDVEPGYYKLVILDAFYKFFPPKTDENDNGAMADLYNWLDHYANYFDSAVALIHHTSKGFQSYKSVTDVGSGAGVQSRAADTHLVMRPHEELGAVVVDAATRSFKPLDPFCIKFKYPLWVPASDLDPADLKAVPGQQGGKQHETAAEKGERLKREADDVLAALPAQPGVFRLSDIEVLLLSKGYSWNQRVLRMNRDQWVGNNQIIEVKPAAGSAPAIYRKP